MSKKYKPPFIPNLFIIGVQKAGTTSIHDILSSHPDIFMTDPKEPGFFMNHENVSSFVTPRHSVACNERPYAGIREYFDLYEGSAGYKWRGEATTGYFQSDHARENIKKWSPDAHILICLREPVGRSYSAYNWARKTGIEPCNSFEEALDMEAARREEGYWFWYDYTGTSRYSENLKKWLNDFANVKIVLFEDLCASPDRVVADVLAWLDLEQTESIPREAESRNPSGIPRSSLGRLARKLLVSTPGKSGPLRSLARWAAKIGMLRRMRTRLLVAIDRDLVPPEPLNPETRARLKSSFADDISALEPILGRDLTQWR